ncbi:MAG: PEGA domain-containing protein [Patescibacteria group bacterium]
MEYPNSKITKPIRTIILVFFIVLFLVLAPGIILYTSGYRYDWQYGLLRETGSINVDIAPDTASIYINDVRIKSGMPVRLNDRVPGKYKILISNDGYFDWQKEVLVKNKQTVYIKDISMLKTGAPQAIISGKDIASIQISRDKKYLAYAERVNTTSVAHLYNLSTAQDTTLFTLSSADGGMKIEFAPNNNYLSVSDGSAPYESVLIFNADEPAKEINLTERIKYPIDKYQWKETVGPELYFSANKRLMSIVATTEQRYVLGKNSWIDWLMQNGQLWTLQTASGTKQIKLVRDTLGFSSDYADANRFTSAEQDLQLAAAYADTILLKKNNKSEMILLSNGNKYTVAGEKFLLSEYNDWLIIWTPWEIWTYSKGEEPNLLNRSGEQLNAVLPLDKYNTLALVWNDKTTALFPYYLVTHDFINASINSTAADTLNRTMYFAGKVNNSEGLWKLNY